MISVIIVSFNTSEVTRKCLQSIFKGTQNFEFEVIVVDNASTDGSVAMLRKEFPQVKVIENKTNVGFGRANNQGAKVAQGKWLLFLNSDTEMKADTMDKVMALIRRDPIGQTLSTKSGLQDDEKIVWGVQLLNRDGSIQPSAGYFPTLGRVMMQMLFLDDLPFVKKWIKPYQQDDVNFYEYKNIKTPEPKLSMTNDQLSNKTEIRNTKYATPSQVSSLRPELWPRVLKSQVFTSVDWVTGAFLLVPKKLYDQVGGFDESIFMYGEEVDLCYRLKQVGARILFSPEASLYHLKGASSQDGFAAAIIGEYKGLITFYQKHWPSQLFFLKLFLTLGALFRILLFGMIKPRKAKVYWKALKGM